MSTESGYQNQKKYGLSQFKTIQPVGSSKYGVNTAQMYLFDVSPSPIAIVNSALDDLDPRIILMEIPSHGARVGDVVRIQPPAALSAWEYDVIGIVDSDILWVYDLASSVPGDDIPQIGDEVKICRWVTAKADSEGSISTSSGPVQFIRNGATTTVVQDTSTPANNRPLPSGMFIMIDGVPYPVGKDTGTPANSVLVPVEISGASGPINITAGDINVQLTDLGANFDRTRVGDGSGNQWGFNASSEGLVHDASVLTAVGLVATEATLSAMSGKLPATLGQKLMAASLAVTLASDQSALAVTMASSPLPTGAATEATLSTLNGKIPANLTVTATRLLVDGSGVTQPISAASLPLPTGAATEATLSTASGTLTAISGKLPATLGQKAMAASLAVVIASDQGNLPTQQASVAGTITSAQKTVGTSAVRATVSGSAPSATRTKLIFKPSKNNTGAIYFGPSTVTTANGVEIIGPDRIEFEFDSGDYYLISDTAGQTVEILEK